MNVSNFVYINSGDSSSSSDTSSTSNKENLDGFIDTREGNLNDLSEGRPAKQQEETSEEATIVVVEPNSDNNQAGASGELAQNILEVLRKRLEPEIQLGPAIHKDISIRWMEICNKGLPKEEQTVIMKKYPVPENCKGINPPILNAEVKASLPEGAINRDARMVSKQKKIGIMSLSSGRGDIKFVN